MMDGWIDAVIQGLYFFNMNMTVKCIAVYCLWRRVTDMFLQYVGVLFNMQQTSSVSLFCYQQQQHGCYCQRQSIINKRSPTVRCTDGVKWYTHFLSCQWAESRLPWRQLGTTIPPPRLEVLEHHVNGLKQLDFVSHDIYLM